MRQRGRSDGIARSTIAQVAALAAVSTATASRVLNDPEAVSAALRDRVGAAVAHLGYIPNQTARALSSLHSGLVGVLVPAINGRHAPMVAAIQHRLGETGYAMLLATTEGDDDRALAEARRMAGREIEGMVLAGIDAQPELRALLDERRIPYVPADGDYVAAGETVGRYLLALGHRSLVFLDGPAQSRSAAALLGGVRAARASQAETPLTAQVLACAEPDHRAELRSCLAAAVAPTALVCADDLLALVALQECAALGIAVPGQMSIIGCGDFPFARHTLPTLSTLRVPSVALGQGAVDQLRSQRGGEPTGQFVTIKLVVRQSSGPAPS